MGLKGIDPSVCQKCKKPLLIYTEDIRLFCDTCHKEIEDSLGKMMEKRGRNIKGKKLIFPKAPNVE